MEEAVSLKDIPFDAAGGAPPRVLAHICCGPCSVAPLRMMLNGRAEVWGYFHNPNIHPYGEFKKRLGAVKELAGRLSLPVICDEEYRPAAFIKGVRGHAGSAERIPPHGARCAWCYSTRLEAAARAAAANGFGFFTSSLLYSKYQDHGAIRRAGVESARKHGVLFIYEDFRRLWQEGLDSSRALGLYTQKYCGCIYSKIERYSEKRRKTASPGTSFPRR